jgi:hypothetical protein
MTKVAALGLPSVDEGYSIRLDFRNLPPKTIVSRMRQQLHDASIFAKPFTNASSDIISVTVLIRRRNSFDQLYFVVHSSTLQRHARATLQDTIPWQMWGPTATRWYPCAKPGTRDVCGQRCLSVKEIWDFNQYRVRYLGQGFAMESEAACVSVVTKPSRVTSHGLKGGVYSSLPYVKLVLKQLKNPGITITWLDDDRIFSGPVSPIASSVPLFDDIIATVHDFGTS